ncbi:hypothetical protein M434DRAFT_143752 [Hypoxylon sp. CO27-5]|nr:hypothetical protein M434DRAFT_143752 [Hypoxylon sp. CO27-5]
MSTHAPTPVPSTLRAVQATSIALLTTTAGLSASTSIFVVPRLMELQPRTLTSQFVRAIQSAHRLLVVPLVLPGFLNAYLAYRLPAKARLYALAAVLTFSNLPWTRAVMMPLNRKMERLNADPDGSENAHEVADKWATRNLYRGVVTFVAGCIGLYAALT